MRSVELQCHPLLFLKVSQVFNSQDKHNASFLSYVLERVTLIQIQKYKSTKIHDTAFFYHGLYLQPNTPICFLVSNPHITQFSILGNQKLKKQIIYNINLFCSTFCESYTKSINNDTNYSNS